MGKIGAKETEEAMKKLADIAALAGVKGKFDADEGHFVTGFNLPGGRSQMVYIRYLGTGPEDKPLVMFFSPARVIKKGLFAGLSQKQAVELLTLNQSMMFARFGIHDTPNAMLVVASVDMLLDTLDVDEFKMATFSVALAADTYEQKYGGDDF